MRKTQVLLYGKLDVLELNSDKMDVLNDYFGVSHSDSHSLKTLGVQVDQSLSFKTMVSDACKAGYLKLEQLKCLRHVLSQELKITMVKCLVLSRVDYCNALYCNLSGEQIRKLQKLVNNSIRFIYCLRKTQSTSEFAIRCHILPVRLRIQYKLGLIAYKIITGVAPSYLCDMVRTRQQRVAGLRSASDSKILETMYPENTISYKICKCWNSLPKTVRDTNFMDNFRRNLKTYFYR